MFNSKISSSLLYHFTKEISVLVSILENGFYPMTAIEDVSFMMPNYPKARVGIPMVCFTDIPIELSEEHRKEYGLYGIGMKKEWGISAGLNPICYMIKGAEIYNAYNHLQWVICQQAQKLDKIENSDIKHTSEVMNAVMNYAGFLKEYSEDSAYNQKPFYDEREWRYLPPFKEDEVGIDGYCNRLMPDIVDNNEERKKLNSKMIKHYTLKFNVDYVEKIIVNDDSEVQILIELLYKSKNISQIEKLISKIDVCKLN